MTCTGGARVFSEALNAAGGWNLAQSPASPQPNSERGMAALRLGVESPLRLFGLHEFPRRGHQLASAGQETIDDETFLRLDATYADGYRAELYLDPRTRLVARMHEHKPLHVDIDPNAKRIETRYSDYRAVAGVLYPFRSEEIDLDTGAVASIADITHLALNTEEALDICSSQPPPA